MKFTYASGQRILDGYTIKRGIGKGGFGEVYYALSDGGKAGLYELSVWASVPSTKDLVMISLRTIKAK